MELSIVIPVYNEENKISGDLDSALNFFKTQNIEGEIIVADDGSIDKTKGIVQEYINNYPSIIRLISYYPNRGKGFAVKSGVLKAKGDIIIFADSGNCVPFSDALKGIQLIVDEKADIAHGSRFLKNSVIVKPRKWHRNLFSYLFRNFITVLAKLPVKLTDTQCGFKIYKKEVAQKLYNLCKTDGFMFDIEIILKARRFGFLIKEFPIEWTTDYDTRVNFKKTLFRIFVELKKIRKEHH